MTVEMLKGKIHRATVTQAELHYVGPSPWTWTCWRQRGFWSTKRSKWWISTTAAVLRPIPSWSPGIGDDLPQRAAARCVSVGQVISWFAMPVTPQEIQEGHHPAVVFCDEKPGDPGNQL